MDFDKLEKEFLTSPSGKAFYQFTNKIKEEIFNRIYKESDLPDKSIKPSSQEEINQIVRERRIKNVNQKIEHTERMVTQIVQFNARMGIETDFALITDLAILYHDIGRFPQVSRTGSFTDKITYANSPVFKNHGDEGAQVFLEHDFAVKSEYKPSISEAIKHHVNPLASGYDFKFKSAEELQKLNTRVNDILTGKKTLSEEERMLVSLLVQLVADIDKSDILYQNLTGDIDMIRDWVGDKSHDPIDIIAHRWGVSKEEILAYNGQTEETYMDLPILKIPIANMDPMLLMPPAHIKEMFYNNSWAELRDLQQDPSWHFVSILWWRLGHFIHNINFTAVLDNMEDANLLEEMRSKFPERLRPVVDEAFDHAICVIKTKKSSEIYTNDFFKR